MIVRNLTSYRGFTLMELMVVLALIGIMTALIIPEMKGTFGDALLRSTGRKLVEVFNLASSRAVTLNEAHRVRIEKKTGHYLIEKIGPEGARGRGFDPRSSIVGGEGILDTRITIEVRQSEEESSELPDQGPAFVSGENLGKRHTDEAIAFNADGTADASEILLRDAAGFRLALRINPITSRVQITELGHQ
jgi:prepilin-type N-terminal cleavage/methylation domain-containing protein